MLHIARPLRSPRTPSAPSHFCLVTETYPPEVNGVAHTLAHLQHALQARGHTVSVVRPRQRGTDETGGSLDTLVYGVPVPGYASVQMGLPLPGQLRQQWTTERPDVVYIATEGPLGWAAKRAAAQLEIPVYSGFHTNFHAYARHYRLGWFHRLIFAYLCYFHRHTGGTLVPNEALRTQLTAAGVPNVHVMGRGVDSDVFSPARRCTALRRAWGAGDTDLVVLSVGRVAAEKNMDAVVAAYRAMQQAHPGVKCVIVGDGPQRVALQQAQPDVRCCGVQTGVDLARHYASADIFLFPSLTETFGNVTLEAMASGLAVVAYNYAAAQQHITHGESGILVPYGASQAFSEAAVALARTPRLVSKLRYHARDAVRTLDWQAMTDRFMAFVQGALDTTPRAAGVAATRSTLGTQRSTVWS